MALKKRERGEEQRVGLSHEKLPVFLTLNGPAAFIK